MTINKFKEKVESGIFNNLLRFSSMPNGLWVDEDSDSSVYITQDRRFNIGCIFCDDVNYNSIEQAIDGIKDKLQLLLDQYQINDKNMFEGYKYGDDFIMYEPNTVNTPQIVNSFYDYDWYNEPNKNFKVIPADKKYVITHNYGEGPGAGDTTTLILEEEYCKNIKTIGGPNTFNDIIFEDNVVVVCDSIDQVVKLLQYAHDNGYTWQNGKPLDSLESLDSFYKYDKVAYNLSSGMYANIRFYDEKEFKILNFNDVYKGKK